MGHRLFENLNVSQKKFYLIVSDRADFEPGLLVGYQLRVQLMQNIKKATSMQGKNLKNFKIRAMENFQNNMDRDYKKVDNPCVM